MTEWLITTWQAFYGWAASQPVFIQIPLGIGLFFVTVYAVVIIIGLLLSLLIQD